MCNRIRHLPCIYCGALGDIIDSQEPDFQGHARRQGANMTIDGAVELVNLRFDIHTDSQEETTEVFKQYHDFCRRTAQIVVKSSNQSGSMMHSEASLVT
ncbi:hypothetical protein BGZ93_008549 [Podila epicladia]|nr:hypothetical protein BGZ92_001190 [Podila epicladia]KAG0091970.1 hypothetical protein BGZ93_008549 [Podila epicladia]